MSRYDVNPRSPSCALCPVRDCLICSSSAKSSIPHFGMLRAQRCYAAGDVVVLAGQPLEFVATVTSGIASFSRTVGGDRRQIVNLAFPSHFIGWPGRAVSPVDITAVTELTVCIFNRAALEARLEKITPLRQRLMEMRLNDLDEARDWLIVLSRSGALEKVAGLLVVIARQLSTDPLDPDGEVNFELPLSRSDMADCLGLSPETVSRQVSVLRRRKIIEVDNKWTIRVRALSRLLEAAGPSHENLMVHGSGAEPRFGEVSG